MQTVAAWGYEHQEIPSVVIAHVKGQQPCHHTMYAARTICIQVYMQIHLHQVQHVVHAYAVQTVRYERGRGRGR